MHAATTPAPLTLEVLAEPLSVCRLRADADLPYWATGAETFSSVTRSADELSVICATASIPESRGAAGDRSAIMVRDDGWRAIKLVGPFALTEVGVLLRIAAPLASAGISILAIGTFDTDYVLVES